MMIKSYNYKIRQETGFSLMELVVSIAVMGILTLVGYGVIALNAMTFNMVNTGTIQRWDIRKAMQMMRHDCQMIDPNNLIGIPSNGNKANRIAFQTIDGNVIRYRRNGSNVLQRRLDAGNWTTLVDNLTVKPFRHLDINLSPTATEADVKFIEVELSRTEDGQTFTLLERFYVRN